MYNVVKILWHFLQKWLNSQVALHQLQFEFRYQSRMLCLQQESCAAPLTSVSQPQGDIPLNDFHPCTFLSPNKRIPYLELWSRVKNMVVGPKIHSWWLLFSYKSLIRDILPCGRRSSPFIQLYSLLQVAKWLENQACTCCPNMRPVCVALEDTRLLRLRALKAKLADTRCKSSLARLNMAMKEAYPVLLASKHSASCQRVYEKEILSNILLLTLTWVYYSSMSAHSKPKLMLFQSRSALKQPIMLNLVNTLRSIHSQRQCFIGVLASVSFLHFQLVTELCASL